MTDSARTTPAGGYVPADRSPAEQQAASPPRSRLPGLLAGITVLVGMAAFVLVPGGGTTETETVIDYYSSESRRGWAYALALVLVAGCLLTMWFFTVLRARLADTTSTRLGYVLAVVGAAMLAGGVCVALGPTGAQTFSEQPFVGVPVAVAMAQGGLAMAIFAGLYPLAVAIVLLSLAARRERAALPAWLATSGVVVGVLLLGSLVGLPAVLLPLWLLVAGGVGLRAGA